MNFVDMATERLYTGSLGKPRNPKDQEISTMANSPQAKKRALQAAKRNAVNKSRLSRIRTFIRKVEESAASGDGQAAAEALRQTQPEIMRGVTKGVLHRNTARRKISRLAKMVKATAQATA